MPALCWLHVVHCQHASYVFLSHLAGHYLCVPFAFGLSYVERE